MWAPITGFLVFWMNAGFGFVEAGFCRAKTMVNIAGKNFVVFGVLFLGRIRLDDPVGALSVHLLRGIWGTLAVGLLATTDAPGGIDANGLFHSGGLALLGKQAVGAVAVGAFTLVFSFVGRGILKARIGLRVTEEQERRGLELSEMGMSAYHDEPTSLSDSSAHGSGACFAPPGVFQVGFRGLALA